MVGRIHFALVLELVFATSALAAPKDEVVSRLPVASQLPDAFRNVSLEQRCQALTTFLKLFVGQHMPNVSFREQSCGEGGGLGGLRYTVEFDLIKEKVQRSYQLQVAYRDHSQVETHLCDISGSVPACTANRPDTVPEFATSSQVTDATKVFLGFHEKAKSFLATAHHWIDKKSSEQTIFKRPYRDFVKSVLVHPKGFPLSKKGKTVVLELKPDDPKAPKTGRVVFKGKVDDSIASCLGCTTVDCLNRSTTYRFENRFLYLTNVDSQSKPQPHRAGWILRTASPEGKDGHGWKFVCGMSRYSLENVNL